MSAAFFVQVAREGLALVLLLSAPPVLLALAAGLAVALVQALTSVQEQVLGYVPKAMAVFVALGVGGPWMAGVITRFGRACFQAAAGTGP
jgi:flagellar biosynthetic protein FliQ